MFRMTLTRLRTRFRRISDRRGHGTPATTAGSFWTRCARRCATCSLDGGTLLVVQSEFAVPRERLAALAGVGLDAEVVAYQWIPFGPVLSARAGWLEDTGRLEPGRREEELVVIRADKP